MPPLLSADATASAVVLQLAQDYRQAREDAGKQGVTDAKLVKKFLFWLHTGRIPGRDRRGFFLYTDLSLSPDWQPLPVTDVRPRHINDYRKDLVRSGSGKSSGRDIDVLAGFFAWLLGTPDTPVAAHRNAHNGDSRGASSNDPDRFYSDEQMAAMLTSSAQQVSLARRAAPGSVAGCRLLKTEVEHVIAWLLWGTGAAAQDLCSLDTDDIDLRAGTICWQGRRDTPLAGGGGDVVLVQPIPQALVAELEHYLRKVRPRLGLTGPRLLGNPDRQRAADSEELDVQVVRRLTQRLAQKAGLASLGGTHSPRRWAVSYGMRVLEAERGTMIALLRLQGLRAYVSLERSYGAIMPKQPEMSIDAVFPELD